MTSIRNDYYSTAGMHKASPAALSCADLTSGFAPSWTNEAERRGGISQPSRFRLFRLEQPSAPSVGVRPDRKLWAEEQSHSFLTFGVCPARNVA
ncbi:hypothetical protein [Mycolicibacterium llatzerense]|uniref:hypothetical protein n=1 Tax=Mycolicibacterium llatzerense TaxID=280871 RepID=UPI0021B600CC|nr:hypothetical protein [Mycolicibacterium llatzerense]